ncbi:Methyl-accepting chemotaxis sensor/transducer protein, partial [hydrothermal vent metagenome]
MLNLKIAHKLPAIIIGSALIVGVAMGLVGLNLGTSALIKSSEAKLDVVADDRSNGLGRYFADIEADLGLTARNLKTREALEAFSAGFEAFEVFGNSATEMLQAAYITDNPNPLGQKDLLDSANQGTPYDIAHARYHPSFRDQLVTRGYYDIFLLNTKGDLVYSVFKELDYATNFAAGGGEWANSDLGNAFRAAMNAQPGESTFFDFKPYGPSAGAPAAFISQPVTGQNGQTIGVLVFQMPIDGINAIMNIKTGLGQTGESIIVGQDFLLRNDSSFTEENDILSAVHDSEWAKMALGGELGIGKWTNEAGVEMELVAEPFEFLGTNWATIAMQELAELKAPIVDLRNWMLMIGGGLLVVASLMALLFARSVTKPISSLTNAMNELAAGDLEVEIVGTGRDDELGDMAKAVEVFKENAIKVSQMTEEEKATAARNIAERSQMMEQLGHAFGDVVGAAVAGDFSKRVEAEFPDDELNQLGVKVNELVQTVERGLGETGDVLAALARTDLTKRVEGVYDGSFDKLKNDTNAVADKLADVIGQLRD